ncbi:MAG TPA: lysylphosphatidylglycerol synthase transmembrane domain-containing protein, partial [Thermoanaerobaculia bacterium]|nr:lysylphosphatidylglycerol synthase transmembrane domain-containing protein [Thermoanaerobaculia bacterium]
YVAPVGVAGEPVKAHLLADAIGVRPAFASLVLHKHAELFAQTLFLLAGVAIALAVFPLSFAIRALAVAGVILLAALLALMTWGLLRGAFAPIVRRAERLPLVGKRLSRFEKAAEELDDTIREFYAKGDGRFFVSAFWCFFGWCGGLLETFLVLKILAPERGLATAYAVEALSMAIGNMLLVVPARLGFAEGVRVGLFALLGLTSAQGLAYGLVRRAREILWTLPGAIVLLWRSLRSRRESDSALAAEGGRR